MLIYETSPIKMKIFWEVTLYHWWSSSWNFEGSWDQRIFLGVLYPEDAYLRSFETWQLSSHPWRLESLSSKFLEDK